MRLSRLPYTATYAAAEAPAWWRHKLLEAPSGSDLGAPANGGPSTFGNRSLRGVGWLGWVGVNQDGPLSPMTQVRGLAVRARCHTVPEGPAPRVRTQDGGAGSARVARAVRTMEPRIDQTEFGSVTIDGEVFTHDVIIRLGGRVEKRKKKQSKAVYGTSHTISLAEAKHVYQKGVARLLIGAGQDGTVALSEEAAAYLERRPAPRDLLRRPLEAVEPPEGTGSPGYRPAPMWLAEARQHRWMGATTTARSATAAHPCPAGTGVLPAARRSPPCRRAA
jgi:hypothetical protein